jgi:hypothetical protein
VNHDRLLGRAGVGASNNALHHRRWSLSQGPLAVGVSGDYRCEPLRCFAVGLLRVATAGQSRQWPTSRVISYPGVAAMDLRRGR